MHLLKTLLLLIVPGLVFLAALYLQVRIVVTDPWLPLLNMFPFLAVFAGLFLGWRFNRIRVIWAIALLVIIDRALLFSTAFGREYVLALAVVLIPVNLVLFNWWSERGLFTVHGLVRTLLLLVEICSLVWLYIYHAGNVIGLLSRQIPLFGALAKPPFSSVGIIAVLLGIIALLIMYCRKPEALEGGFCWVLVTAVAGLWWPDNYTYWAGVAVLLLVVALVESSFRMAYNDELTGLPGRRAMNESLLKVGRRYTLAMVDVDHFKKVNDTHGHDVGDQVLRMVATCLRRVTGGGRAYRYGGEEFTVIFPNKNLERALPHLERLRETIASAGFMVRGKNRPKQKPENTGRRKTGTKNLTVTVSIGVAARDEKNNTPELLIKAADHALYKAKKGGRNQICS